MDLCLHGSIHLCSPIIVSTKMQHYFRLEHIVTLACNAGLTITMYWQYKEKVREAVNIQSSLCRNHKGTYLGGWGKKSCVDTGVLTSEWCNWTNPWGAGVELHPLTQEERKLLVRGCLFSFCKCDTEDLWGQLCDEGLLIPTAVQAPYQHEGIHLVWDSDYYHYTNTILLLIIYRCYY